MSQELKDYVSSQLHGGIHSEDIRRELFSAGWSGEDIGNAFQISEHSVPGKLKSVRSLMKETWRMFRPRAKTLLSLAIFPAIVGLVIAGVVIGAIVIGVQNSTWPMVVLFALVLVVLLLSVLPVQPAILANFKEDSDMGFKESYALGFKYLRAYLWVIILHFMVIVGSVIALALPVIIVAGWLALIQILSLSSPLTRLVLIIGYTLLSIPVMILIVRLALSPILTVAEDLHGMDALIRSRELTRGKWWKVAWRLFVPSLIVLLAQLLILILPSIAQKIANVALSIFSGILILGYEYLLYKDLRQTYVPSGKSIRKWPYILLSALALLVIVVGIAATLFLLSMSRTLPLQGSLLLNIDKIHF